MAFSFPGNLRKSSSTAFRFLPRLSNFFNGFPLSETAFRFLQRLSSFPQRLSTFWEIRENLSMAANIRKIAIRASHFPLKIAIFRDIIIGGWNLFIGTPLFSLLWKFTLQKWPFYWKSSFVHKYVFCTRLIRSKLLSTIIHNSPQENTKRVTARHTN